MSAFHYAVLITIYFSLASLNIAQLSSSPRVERPVVGELFLIVIPTRYSTTSFANNLALNLVLHARTKFKREVSLTNSEFNSFVLYQLQSLIIISLLHNEINSNFVPLYQFLYTMAASIDLNSNSSFTLSPRKATEFKSLSLSDWCLLTVPSFVSATSKNIPFSLKVTFRDLLTKKILLSLGISTS